MKLYNPYEIGDFTEQELLELQTTISDRLNKINKNKVKNKVKNKTKLSQLTTQDKIFGIRLSWDKDNGKYLKELDAKWIVDFVGYCDVIEYTDKKYRNNEFNRIGISHKTVTFGISVSITDEEADKPYLLFIGTSSTGYDGFYTLLPESWQTDIQEELKATLKQRKHYQDIEAKKLKEKVKLVINNKEKINNFIKNLS